PPPRGRAPFGGGMAAPASTLWKEDAAPSEKLRHAAGFIHAAALRRRPPALYNARRYFSANILNHHWVFHEFPA
ncbi:MAG: hypothetical protein ACFN9G_13355, partial [Cardiobacterium sp.]